MPDTASIGGFLTAAFFVTFLWGRALWYLDERSQAFRRIVFLGLGFTRRQPSEVRALLLSAIYYGVGLAAALLFAIALSLHFSSLISFSSADLGLTVLGSVAEISLTSVLVAIAMRATGQEGSERFAEIQDIPWMKGLRQLPAAIVPAAAAFGGVVEELFFRGVLLRICLDKLRLAPPLAIVLAGTLFCAQQLVQVRTMFQALVIGCGCVAISAIGGLLVVVSGSVIPAVLCHASFVIFFLAEGIGAPRSNDH